MVHKQWRETSGHTNSTKRRCACWYRLRLCVPSVPLLGSHVHRTAFAGSTYPLDLVRSRLSIATASIPIQTAATSSLSVKPVLASGYHTASAPSPLAPKPLSSKDLTMWGMTMKVVREEGGVRALYRGIIATAVGVAPYVGACREISPCSVQKLTGPSHLDVLPIVCGGRNQLRRLRSAARGHHATWEEQHTAEAALRSACW